MSLNRSVLAPRSTSRRAFASIAARPAYASMQPRRPQGQRAPPFFTTMWPISPAAPRPSQRLPSRISPPPTPVPQNTPSSDRYGLPAPSSNSALVATSTSLPSRTGAPSAFSSHGPSSNDPSQPGRFRASDTTPVASSTSPGEPTPIPPSESLARSAAPAASVSASAICRATSSGPPFVGVGSFASPITSPFTVTMAAWILVPPRSIPPRGAVFERLGAGMAASLSGCLELTEEGLGVRDDGRHDHQEHRRHEDERDHELDLRRGA